MGEKKREGKLQKPDIVGRNKTVTGN